ncbi:hypothetical protein V6N11_075245 [Hibiscus sabdariffa]|uniref:RNase H type-1 domain-containing protein n=1 Tax=Hibiscus sabdariffa TaxID=183260 RepID=A0ABR2R6N1_9ROSI
MTVSSKFAANAAHWPLLFPYILWNLWKRRNDTMFQVCREYRDSIYAHSVGMVALGICDSGLSRAVVVDLGTDGGVVGWQKPPHGWCKLNSDGAVCRRTSIAACGGVIRDAAGRWMLGYSKRIGVCSVLESELWRLFEGLVSAWSLRIRCLIVETDSLEAYRLVTNPTVTGGGFTLLAFIVELASHNWEIRFRHVHRGGNVLADRMAKMALDSDLIVHRFLDPPLDCSGLVVEDAAVADGVSPF